MYYLFANGTYCLSLYVTLLIVINYSIECLFEYISYKINKISTFKASKYFLIGGDNMNSYLQEENIRYLEKNIKPLFEVAPYLIQPEFAFFKVYYISDIHLETHLKKDTNSFYPNKKEAYSKINEYVDSCFSEELIKDFSFGNKPIILFLGDTGDFDDFIAYFYHRFALKYKCYLYKYWKKKNAYKSKTYNKYFKDKFEYAAFIDEQLNELDKSILKDLKKINQYIKYSLHFTKEKTILNKIKQGKIPDWIYPLHNSINKKLNKKDILFGKKDNFSDLSLNTNIFFVLGNHERIVPCEETIEFYTRFAKKEKITFLNNNFVTVDCSYNKIILYGGTGFPKNGDTFNSDLKYEMIESQKEDTVIFNSNLNNLLDNSTSLNIPILVLSHYNPLLWSSQLHSKCIYFSGHSHQNNRFISSSQISIFDNQIGYHNKISLKSFTFRPYYNPFSDLNDGIHTIDIEQYESYLSWACECNVKTKDLRRLSALPEYSLILMKKHGYYAIFLTSQNKLYICDGGKKRVIDSTFQKKKLMKYYESFDDIINIYLSSFNQYFSTLYKISDEVKSLGFSGHVHGSIIDLDWCNHIMLNPIDGKFTFYYSPIFGITKTYDSFQSLLENQHLNQSIDVDISNSPNLLINRISSNNNCNPNNLVSINISESPYVYSNVSKKIQRLFTKNWLRVWPNLQNMDFHFLKYNSSAFAKLDNKTK